MALFEKPEEPIFDEKLTQLKTSDRAYAPLFNTLFSKLFVNTLFLKKKAEENAKAWDEITQVKADVAENTADIDTLNSRISNCILEMPTNPTYSGADITVYAGTKMLFPDGKNADGTLKSIELTLPADITVTVVGLGNGGTLIVNNTGQLGYRHPNHTLEVEKFADLPATVADNHSYRAYVRSENKVYDTSSSITASWHVYYAIVLGEYTWASNAIKSLTLYKPFRMADYNEVNKELSEVVDTKLSEVDTKLSDLKTNFQDGCSKIASAITANGVSTASNASPATMATNIGNVRSGGTANADKILSGYTAYSGKTLLNGTNLGYTVGYNTGNTAGYNDGYSAGNTAGYNAGYNTVNLEALLVANSPNISYTTTRTYRFIIGILTGQHDYTTSGSAWISNGGGGAVGYIKQNNLITVSGTSQRVTITVAWFSGVPQGGTVAMGSNFFGSATQCFGAFIGI